MFVRDDFILIASADENNGIGKENALLVRFTEDMKHFSAQTTGHTVIMGRKTFQSLPNGPLPNRSHIVLSRNKYFSAEGATVVHNLHELFDVVEGAKEKLFVIGGASIYKELLPFCSRAVITHIEALYAADAFLPELSVSSGWICVEEGLWQVSKSGVKYCIKEYERLR